MKTKRLQPREFLADHCVYEIWPHHFVHAWKSQNYSLFHFFFLQIVNYLLITLCFKWGGIWRKSFTSLCVKKRLWANIAHSQRELRCTTSNTYMVIKKSVTQTWAHILGIFSSRLIPDSSNLKYLPLRTTLREHCIAV